jgi:hypothetical protein
VITPFPVQNVRTAQHTVILRIIEMDVGLDYFVVSLAFVDGWKQRSHPRKSTIFCLTRSMVDDPHIHMTSEHICLRLCIMIYLFALRPPIVNS